MHERKQSDDDAPPDVAGDHHLLAVPAVEQSGGEGAEEEAGDEPGGEDDADSDVGVGLVDSGRQAGHGEETDPVAQRRDDLGREEPPVGAGEDGPTAPCR